MGDSLVLIDRTDGVVTLTLNRPQAMNALSRGLRAALIDAFDGVSRDSDAEVVILTGAGRAFCAGIDLKELGGEHGLEPDLARTVSGNDLVEAIGRCPQPIIGAVNGVAITGGFELALACDLLIASSAARFADTHARVGILPGWGLSQKLSRWIGIGRAKELSLTGNYLPAEQAERWGLVNRVVAPEDLLATCTALAQDMRSCGADMLRQYKRVIDAGYATTLADGLQLESAASRAHVRNVTPEAIAARRSDVQARGRAQSRS